MSKGDKLTELKTMGDIYESNRLRFDIPINEVCLNEAVFFKEMLKQEAIKWMKAIGKYNDYGDFAVFFSEFNQKLDIDQINGMSIFIQNFFNITAEDLK